MNIIIRTFNGNTVSRPDTTYKREDGASFLPEFVSQVSASPVLFARMCRAGRSIQEKFVSRYVANFGIGALLYPENLIDGGIEGYASACCLDHTTFLSTKELSEKELSGYDFDVKKDGVALFQETIPSPETVLKAVCEASRRCYLRTGDIVCAELGMRKRILSEPGQKCVMEIRSGEELLHEFDVII